MDSIDISELSDILGTSDSLVIHPILQVWLESFPQRIEDIKKALEAKDRSSLRKAVHGAKGTALQIGAKKLAAICKKLEDQAESVDWNVISDLGDEIIKEDVCTRNCAKKILSGT